MLRLKFAVMGVILMLLGLAACGGGGLPSLNGGGGNGGGSPSVSAPMMVSAGDAPLANVITADVTVSAVSLTNTQGQQVQVLAQPQTLELANLVGVREPLHLGSITGGSYNAVTVTVTAANIVYIDPSSGQVVTANASIQNGTVSVALNPTLTVDSDDGLQMHLDFNLEQSLSFSNNTVTFTPAIHAAWGKEKDLSSVDRDVRVVGSVTAVNSSSITVQAGDSNRTWAFVIDSSTRIGGGLGIAQIQAGSVVLVRGQVQDDGSLVAQHISSLLSGQVENQSELALVGVVASTTKDSSGAVTSFTMAVRYGFGSGTFGDLLTVGVNSSTIYSVGDEALAAGLTASSFNNAQLFPGQAVLLIGDYTGNNNLTAQEIRLCGEGTHSTLAAAVQGSSPNFTFTLQLPAWSFLTQLDQIGTLNASTSSATEYGDAISSSGFAATPVGTPLTVHGYLLQSGGVYTLYATHVNQTTLPETPEN
jgi:hypothetical protein